MSTATAATVGLTAVAGIAGAIQAAVMGRFGERIGVFEAFAFAAIVTALVAVALLLAARQTVSGIAEGFHEPAWLWIGGFMGALIVLTITVAAPRIGTAATIGIIVAGNLAMAAVIDRFGLFGLEQIPLRWPRVAGLLLLAAGAALTLRR